MYASKSGEVAICKLLLKAGNCNANLSDREGNTALHLGSVHGNVEVVKVLLSFKGINIFAKNNQGKSALESTFYPGVVRAFQCHFVSLQTA